MSDESERRSSKDRKASADAPQKRELEQAPQYLRKAATVLVVGALFPWLTSISTHGHMPWGAWVGGLALTLAGGWVMIESAKAGAGLKANGAVAGIAGKNPMAGNILGLVLFIGAVVMAFSAAAYFEPQSTTFHGFALTEGAEGMDEKFRFRAVLEFGTLLLGLATLAHILAYEYGGKFNPVFPLMFMGPAVAGVLQVLGAVGQLGDNTLAPLGLIGSGIVAAGGIMAMYTMYVSMKTAKVEGDLKRAAARERKRAERSSRSSS